MTDSTRRQVRRDEDRSRYELVEDGSVVGYADFRSPGRGGPAAAHGDRSGPAGPGPRRRAGAGRARRPAQPGRAGDPGLLVRRRVHRRPPRLRRPARAPALLGVAGDVLGGRPVARGRATTSSCSALARSGDALDPHGATVDVDRGHRPLRRPALEGRPPAHRTTRWPPAGRRATDPASAGSASAETVCAGRPFFITVGVTHASCAPASSRATTASASVSPVTSSTFVSTSTTG